MLLRLMLLMLMRGGNNLSDSSAGQSLGSFNHAPRGCGFELRRPSTPSVRTSRSCIQGTTRQAGGRGARCPLRIRSTCPEGEEFSVHSELYSLVAAVCAAPGLPCGAQPPCMQDLDIAEWLPNLFLLSDPCAQFHLICYCYLEGPLLISMLLQVHDLALLSVAFCAYPCRKCFRSTFQQHVSKKQIPKAQSCSPFLPPVPGSTGPGQPFQRENRHLTNLSMGRGEGGCYTGKDTKTGEFTARRREFDRVREPPYPISAVAACSRDLEVTLLLRAVPVGKYNSECSYPFSQGSVLLWPPSREVWFSYLPEMLLVCNEAARRYAQKNSFKRKNDADGVQSKPLGLEYIADR